MDRLPLGTYQYNPKMRYRHEWSYQKSAVADPVQCVIDTQLLLMDGRIFLCCMYAVCIDNTNDTRLIGGRGKNNRIPVILVWFVPDNGSVARLSLSPSPCLTNGTSHCVYAALVPSEALRACIRQSIVIADHLFEGVSQKPVPHSRGLTITPWSDCVCRWQTLAAVPPATTSATDSWCN